MLEKLHFLDFHVNASDFKMNGDPDDGGRYKVTFSKFNFESGIDEDGDNMLRIAVCPKVSGYPDGTDEPVADEVPVFEVNLDLTLFFEISDQDLNVDLEFYKGNSWFFKNHITTAVKLATESMLKYTPMYELSMPWVVPE